MKTFLKIFLIGMIFGLLISIPKLVRAYDHYKAVEQFDQIENILRKGQKIKL